MERSCTDSVGTATSPVARTTGSGRSGRCLTPPRPPAIWSKPTCLLPTTCAVSAPAEPTCSPAATCPTGPRAVMRRGGAKTAEPGTARYHGRRPATVVRDVLPPTRGHADRLRAGLPRPCRPDDRGAHRPGGAQGQGSQRPRPVVIEL